MARAEGAAFKEAAFSQRSAKTIDEGHGSSFSWF
jgi:hypothetical protein